MECYVLFEQVKGGRYGLPCTRAHLLVLTAKWGRSAATHFDARRPAKSSKALNKSPIFPRSCTYFAVSPRRILTTPARCKTQDAAAALSIFSCQHACNACAPSISASTVHCSLRASVKGIAGGMSASKTIWKYKPCLCRHYRCRSRAPASQLPLPAFTGLPEMSE